MVLVSKLDEYGRAGWIAAMVLGFWCFWPIGLAVLGFLAWSGRFRYWRAERAGRWQNTASDAWGGGCGWKGRGRGMPSGNRAFDDYRTETLKRLEDEQREFVEYLERLRQAKDKAEFDQFMEERRRAPRAQDNPPAA